MGRYSAALAALVFAGCAAWAQGDVPGDTDGDGYLSREEFRNRAAQIAFGADKNNDGLLSPDEYRFGPDEYRAMGISPGQPVPADQFVALLVAGFDRLDKDGDGRLSAEERAT